MYKRPIYDTIFNRLYEKRKFIQVLSGPRQTGKTTLAKQIITDLDFPSIYISADEPITKDNVWLEQQWQAARFKVKEKGKALLVIDELQKVQNWAETVKRLWDEDTFTNTQLYLMILGSSQLLLQKGLTESLAGRFEINSVTHWSFREMHDAFKWDVEEYIYYGGYPGSAELVVDQERWQNYVRNSLIETTISKDILLITRVDKPVLLRRLFELGCTYSGRILSYQKMLGQLQDAGNTTTLAHYLDLVENAGLLAGLSKFSNQKVRQRASSPKFQVLNTALLSAQSSYSFSEAVKNRDVWGHFVETSVGALLYNKTRNTGIELYYWNESNKEVDFILVKNREITAIEVKSGIKKESFSGMNEFCKKFKVKKKILVGEGGIPVKDFLNLKSIQDI